MPDSDLSLLLRIRGDSTGGTKAVTESRTALTQLRTQVASDSKAMQQATTAAAKGPQSFALSLQTVQTALQGVGGPLGQFGGHIGNVTSMFASFSGEATAAGGALAGMTGPIGIAVAGLIATAAAITTVVTKLVELTVSTADWQGKLYDLSQQTDVSVTTLGTLEVALRKTGSNLDSASSSLVIFQTQLAEAQDPGSKAAELFKRLGITATDTETAFRQALKAVYEMPEGFERVNAAAELFGRRGAKQLLAATNETRGDLDALTRKLEEFNVLLSDDAAKAADEFNDQLLLVQLQLRGAGAEIGQQFLPTVLSGLNELSKAIKDNKVLIDAIAASVKIFIGLPLEAFVRGNIGALKLITPVLVTAAEGYERLAAAMQLVTGSVPNVDPNAIPAVNTTVPQFGGAATLGKGIFRAKGSGGGGGGGGGRGSGSRERVDELAKLLDEQRRQLTGLTGDSSSYAQAVDRVVEAILRQQRALTLLQQTQVEEARANASSLEAAEKEKKAREELARIREDAIKWIQELNREVVDAASGTDEYDQKLRSLTERLSGIGQKFDANTLKLMHQNIFFARSAKLTEDATKFLDEFNGEAEDLHAKLSQFLDPTGSGTAYLKWLENVGQAIKDANSKQLLDDLNRAMGERIEAKVGPAPPPMVIDPTEEARQRRIEQMKEELSTVNILSGAYGDFASSLASGVGSLIENFILMGKAGPDAFKKVVAAALASVAARAAADAIYELAIGFAALTPWGAAIYGPAVMHFKAAALLGGIALAAGAAGRLVAGNSFSKDQVSGGAGSGAPGGGGRSTGQGERPGVTDINRRSNEPQRVVVELRLAGRVGDLIEAEWLKKYHGGGRLRNTVLSDGSSG